MRLTTHLTSTRVLRGLKVAESMFCFGAVGSFRDLAGVSKAVLQIRLSDFESDMTDLGANHETSRLYVIVFGTNFFVFDEGDLGGVLLAVFASLLKKY